MTCPPRTRRLKFDLARNEIFQIEGPPEDEEEPEIDDIWWSSDEFSRIKASTRIDSKQWRKTGYGILLKDSFQSPRPDTQDYLNAFCQLPDDLCRRGLERNLHRQHGEERSELKERSRQSLLHSQRRLIRQKVPMSDMLEQLATAYQEMTRPAKVFARRLGKADQVVVAAGEDLSIADQICEIHERQARANRMDRRFSNMSGKTNTSQNSLDSRRRFYTPSQTPRKPGCPASPATPLEEYYAAIA